jgi:ribosomal protein S18 acetylase RimI-like enzyme
MQFKLVDSFSEAMQVRTLRNECRVKLTNSSDYLSVINQTVWYFGTYRKARKVEKYLTYLLTDENDSPVGYGARDQVGDRLLLTICIGLSFRGRRYGRVIMDKLIEMGKAEKRDLICEIWATNVPSLALARSVGFEFQNATIKNGQELQIYLLSFASGSRGNRVEAN